MLPIMLISLAYILGIIGGLYKFCIVPFCLILCIIFLKKDKKIILLAIILFIVGIVNTNVRKEKYDTKYSNGEITMQAKIISDAEEKEKVISYIIKNNQR